MKKNICFVIHTLSGGGAEKILVNTVNSIDKDKFNITVLSIVDTGILRWELNDYINYKTIFKKPFRNKDRELKNKNYSGHLLSNNYILKKYIVNFYIFFWKYFPIKILNKLFISSKNDINISFLEGISSKLVSFSNSKKYTWVHIDIQKEKKSEKVFKNINEEKKIYNKFDKIICVSNDVRKSVISKYNIDDSKVEVIYNLLDESEIIEKSFDIQLNPNKIGILKIISVGRLSKQKGYDRLIVVANRLLELGYDFNIDIYGEGPEKNNLLKMIKEYNLSNIVNLKGFTNNPYPFIRESDLFICSSLSEGYSTVISESIIIGTPVLSTLCSGVEEQLKNGLLGIISENSTEDLFYKLKYILDNKQILVKYRKNIEKYNEFKKSNTVLEIENLLNL